MIGTIAQLKSQLKPNTGYIGLVTNYFNTDVIEAVSKIGTIAGGAILYCFDPENQTVNDIDVFVDSVVKVQELVDILTINFTVTKLQKFGSVVEVVLENNPTFQIIMVLDATPSVLLPLFDLDYVRCSYVSGQFVTTPEFDQALKNKTIVDYKCTFTSTRIGKAINKGYKVPQELMVIHDLFKFTTIPLPTYTVLTPTELANMVFTPLVRHGFNYNHNPVELDLETEQNHLPISDNSKLVMVSVSCPDIQLDSLTTYQYQPVSINISTHQTKHNISEIQLKFTTNSESNFIDFELNSATTLIENAVGVYLQLDVDNKEYKTLLASTQGVETYVGTFRFSVETYQNTKLLYAKFIRKYT
jgi:hypothetical protein